jgi:serine/threonine-protein kinase
MPFPAGTSFGPYEIVAPLGAGGMGEVYRARDTRLDREVAVKVLPEAARGDAEARGRFRREALALSRLNHPNIEMVLDLGESAGADYLVLEYVPGETLAERLARGRVPEREAAELGAQAAEALAEAHERGVLHRDLKPGNIMVTPKGRVKVLDFGLARLAQAPSEDSPTLVQTQAGTATGTPAYMAPEQLLGEPLDARADLWALGVVLYEMLTGGRPFRAPLATALANEILHGRLVNPRQHEPSLSAGSEAVVLRALERDRARRYQTAGEMLGELRRLAAGDAGGPLPSTASGATAPARRVTSIAVLPLENLSGDPAQEYFSDGMTEELISCLAQVRALRVISRTSVMRYKGQRKAIPEIARELNVDAVVEGSVRRAGERVKISAQLIEAATERHLWARAYERDLKEVFALQGEVATAIVDEIQVSVTPQEETRLKGGRTVDPEAYETYLKGRYQIEQRTESALRGGLALLERAVERDERLALAHVGIADAWNLMGFMSVVPSREAFPRAQAAARRALAVEPASGEAFTSLGYAALWHDWDPEESERLFRRAVDLSPKYSQAHLWFTNHLVLMGRFEEADEEARLARVLDPQSNVAMAFTGWHPYWQGRFEASRQRLRSAAEQIPGFGPLHYWLGLACMRTGRDAEAVAAFERALALLGRTPMVLSGLATAHALAGRGDEARALLAELERLAGERYVGPYHIAQVQTALGERDAAFASLERAVDERVHWMAAFHLDPSFAGLRDDPRFAPLVTRIGTRG